MFDWKVFEKHKSVLSQIGPDFYGEMAGQHHIDLRPVQLLRWIEFCKDDLEYITLLDIAAVDRRSQKSKWGHDIELVYLLFSMENHQRLSLHVHLDAHEIVPSIAHHYPHAIWMEREQGEMLGIRFDQMRDHLLLPQGLKFNPLLKDAKIAHWPLEGSPALPKIRINPNKSEAPYPEESYIWKHYGLLDSMTAGKFEWQVCFDPTKVVDSKTRIGFHHRGLEKMLEKKNWLHVMQLVDLLNPGIAPTYATIWAKNLEDILRVKLPERAQAIRIVMLELARVADHLTVLQEMCFAMSLDEHRLFLNAREKIYELMEKYSGHRQGMGIIRLGGVREDFPHGWVIEFQTSSTQILKTLKTVHKALISKNDFRSSLDHSGVNAQTVLQWGVSGPAMRASGLNFDLRKSQPIYFYQDIDFDIPVGIHGTPFDRYLIRYEEIHQSVRIINQVLDNLPLGEVINPLYLEDQMSIAMKLESISEGWHYTSLEAPNGEAGFFHLHSEKINPLRLKIKTPSFSLTQALKSFVSGSEEGQLKVNLASLGIRPAELDR